MLDVDAADKNLKHQQQQQQQLPTEIELIAFQT